MSSRPVFSLRLPPATKDALIRNGYEKLQDLLSTEPATIARDLNISPEEAEDIIHQVRNPSTQRYGMPLTQSAAAIIKSTQKFSTRWPPLDKLLNGGLVQGRILEISGPPGCPKETVAIDITSSFLQAGEDVLFVDCQNMTSPLRLRDHLTAAGCLSHLKSLHLTHISSASELMVFLHAIHPTLDSKPKVSLLVIGSFSFPFSTISNYRVKAGILEQVKHILAQVSATRNMTIVITSQLATKMMKEDGSYGTFDEGARGIVVPQLGLSYLPPGRSHRVILSMESPVSGTMYLLPTTVSQTPHVEAIPQEPYAIPSRK